MNVFECSKRNDSVGFVENIQLELFGSVKIFKVVAKFENPVQILRLVTCPEFVSVDREAVLVEEQRVTIHLERATFRACRAMTLVTLVRRFSCAQRR